MGPRATIKDFEWTDQEEPHAKRRKEILEKYPEIKQLFGFDPTFKWKVLLLVSIQICTLPFVSNMNWVPLFMLAYIFGGTINHSLMLAMHELAHNLSYGHARPVANRLLGIFADLPTGFPTSVIFKKYHLEHHRYQGDEVYDSDIPSDFEVKLFSSTFGKLIWMILQPLFYAFRGPVFLTPRSPTKWQILNYIIQMSFNSLVYYFFGGKAIAYLMGGTLLATGLHPMAGHFISEHYMFSKGFETYSYYGSLNYITWNVGYHNEHHDFPAVPGCNLPMVKEIAKEYYDTLPHHDSWVKVIYDFITDPSIGPYSRMKRRNHEKAMKGKMLKANSKLK